MKRIGKGEVVKRYAIGLDRESLKKVKALAWAKNMTISATVALIIKRSRVK